VLSTSKSDFSHSKAVIHIQTVCTPITGQFYTWLNCLILMSCRPTRFYFIPTPLQLPRLFESQNVDSICLLMSKANSGQNLAEP